MRDKIIGMVPMLTKECVKESDNDVNKLKCTVNTETKKIKMLKKLGLYTDAVRGRTLTQSEIM